MKLLVRDSKVIDNIALIIVHYGDEDITYRCINSIGLENFSKLKVIVVNNTSQNLKFEKFSEMYLVNAGENRGYSAACNIGITEGSKLGANSFVLCNNDIKFTKEFFTKFLSQVCEINYPVLAAPRINHLSMPDSVWYLGGRINKFKMEGIHETNLNKNDLHETEFVSGCCFYLSEKAFEIIGMMDESFFMYDEDLDYSIRASDKGIKLMVDPTVAVYHDESSSTKEDSKIGKYNSEIYFHKLRSKILVTRKHSRFPYSIINWIYILYKFCKYNILFLIRSEPKSVLKLIKVFY